MRALFPLWLVLIAATLISIVAAHEPPTASFPANTGALAVLTIAAIKVRFVILDFMDVRTAPVALRIFMEAWVVATWLMLCALHTLL